MNAYLEGAYDIPEAQRCRTSEPCKLGVKKCGWRPSREEDRHLAGL
jgi:hypothetical protein